MKKDVKTAKNNNPKNPDWATVVGTLFWLAVISLFILMVGCGTTRKKTQSSDISKVSDTTFYRKSINVKDTLIYVPGAKLKVSVPASQLDNGQPVETQTDRGSIILKKNGENIEAVCMIDDLVKVIQLQNTVIENISKINTERLKIDKTETVKTPWYMFIPWSTTAILAILLASWMYKNKRSII